MKRGIVFLWQFLSYCLVAGLAWFWVLGIQFSVWRLMGIAFLQVLTLVVTLALDGATKSKAPSLPPEIELLNIRKKRAEAKIYEARAKRAREEA